MCSHEDTALPCCREGLTFVALSLVVASSIRAIPTEVDEFGVESNVVATVVRPEAAEGTRHGTARSILVRAKKAADTKLK